MMVHCWLEGRDANAVNNGCSILSLSLSVSIGYSNSSNSLSSILSFSNIDLISIGRSAICVFFRSFVGVTLYVAGRFCRSTPYQLQSVKPGIPDTLLILLSSYDLRRTVGILVAQLTVRSTLFAGMTNIQMVEQDFLQRQSY